MTTAEAARQLSNKAQNLQGRFGMFGGVFTPCTLTILGVIMFLRFGQVVGNAGMLMAIAIVLLSKVLTTLTTLSLSAIATNTRVEGGGAYYLISRSLGIEFGGTIGFLFFVAQAVSVSMYVIGFTETLATLTGPLLGFEDENYIRLFGTVINLVVFICVFIGAGWTIKVQYFILAILVVSILAFFAGAIPQVSMENVRANLNADFTDGQSFFTMFALFFPAVTGIMAGANMSGDLKDPAKSIPSGTLLSIVVTGVVYVLMAIMLGAAAGMVPDPQAAEGSGLQVRELTQNNQIVTELSIWGPLVIAGIFAATLSSALGSMMGSPRILQAVAKDEVFQRIKFLAKGSGTANEPRRATILTFIIAQGGVMIGSLDVIAPIITMFFMITYGALNMATFYEAFAGNPSYRPKFRWNHWVTSLIGALGCLAVMFLIEWHVAIIAIVLMGGLYWWISRQRLVATFGDVHGGAAFQRARGQLLRLENERYHPKNWRPSILAFSGGAFNRTHMAVFGHWLSSGRGLLSLAQIIPGKVGDHLERRDEQEEALRDSTRELNLQAFSTVLVAPTFGEGVEALVQCSGIGKVRPNVVMLGWSSNAERRVAFGESLRLVSGMRRNLLVLKFGSKTTDPWIPENGTVDVWWRGKANGQLMLIFAHLLVMNRAWRGRKIRLLRLIQNEDRQEAAMEHLKTLIKTSRIDAEPVVIYDHDVKAAIQNTSKDASVVFLGFQPPEQGEEMAFFERMDTLSDGLKTVVFTYSTGDTALEA